MEGGAHEHCRGALLLESEHVVDVLDPAPYRNIDSAISSSNPGQEALRTNPASRSDSREVEQYQPADAEVENLRGDLQGVVARPGGPARGSRLPLVQIQAEDHPISVDMVDDFAQLCWASNALQADHDL